MKNHIFIVVLIPIFTLSSLQEINGSEITNSIKTDEINILKEENKELLQEIRLCNGINIGISLFGLTSGITAILGILLKDKVLELTGTIGSTVSTTLLITTQCMQCCQNSSDDMHNKDLGDL